jgi:hypothetical protein
MHPDFGWIPSWVSAFPRFPRLSAVNRLWSLPGTDRFRETRFFPKPVEPNDVFRHWLSGYFSEVLDEPTVRLASERLPKVFGRMLRAQGKRRFLVKMVGRPVKVELLNLVFPDAFFVHVVRDLKPTVASLLQVEFYQQTALDPWPWGRIPEEYLEFYRRSGKAVEVSAGIKVRLNRSEVERQLARIEPDRWIELPYSDFVADPIPPLRQIADRAEISLDEDFVRRVKARKVYSGADHKWKKYFSPAQIKNLDMLEFIQAPV